MILRTIFFMCAFIVYPSMGKLDYSTFSEKFEEMCFQNDETDPFQINGQETPISNTLENFIAMAEKFEAANPLFNLKDELGYFISEYVFENLEITKGVINQWKISRASTLTIESMWDPANQGYKSDRTDVNDPFSDDEKCSLYYMISHSLLKKDSELLKSYSPRNISYEPRLTYSDAINPDDYFPQELGVVAIKGTDAAVSLSKVLIGLYVGLDQNRKRDLTTYESIHLEKIPSEALPKDTQVDELYSVTLAEILMQSNWAATTRTGLAPNGQWVSIPIGQDKLISGFCPMVYKQQVNNGELPAYSYSSIRGAADGLILGLSILPIYKKKENVKLSQILRMYYSPDGLRLESQAEEDINVDQVSFCQRQGLIQYVESKLLDQMKSYGILVSQIPKDVPSVFTAAKKIYEQERSKIYNVDSTEIRDYCSRPISIEKPEDLPTETYLDVIVVLDSNTQDNFYQEQLIVGHLAKRLDLRYTGSRMTILLDHAISSGSGTSSKLELKPVVNDTSSSACAACMVGQIQYEPSTMEEHEVIMAINQLLDDKRRNDTNKHGANGKVVIYFNYDSENGRSNNKIQGKLEKALRDLRMEHLDVLVYAVGLDPETLKKYVTADQNLVFLGTDGSPEDVAKKIFEKLSYAPALLQYTDCKDGNSETGAVYENFVSPLTVQHYEMPAEYFYKSFSLSVNFESQNGYIKVCYNRRTPKPENIEKFCKNTTATTGVEFKLSNPCKSMSKHTCSPLRFSIMGMNTVTDMKQDNRQKNYCNDINDHWCNNLNQIKFRVTHSGIRCSGCLGLSAPPAVILFAILLSYILLKRF